GGKDDVLAVARPAFDAIALRMKREAPRFAAIGRDDVDVGVVTGRSAEGDERAVGGEVRIGFDVGCGGQASCSTAGPSRNPEVASVREHDGVAADVGVTQEAGALRREGARNE